MKKATLSNKDKNLFLILGAIIIGAVVVVGVHVPNSEKIASLEDEILRLTPVKEESEMHLTNLETYRADTKAAQDYIQTVIDHYPSRIDEEDFIAWTLRWEEDIDIDIDTIALTQPALLSDFIAKVDVEGVATSTSVATYSQTLNTSVDLTYDQLKDTIKYVYDNHDRMSIENTSITYDAGTGELKTSIVINKYTMNYEGAPYEPEVLPDVPTGTDEIFGDGN